MKIVRYRSGWNPTAIEAVAESVGIAPHNTLTLVKRKGVFRTEQQDVFPPAVVQATEAHGWWEQYTARLTKRPTVRTSQNFGLGTPGAEPPEISFPEGWTEQSATVKRARPRAIEGDLLPPIAVEPQEPQYGWFEDSDKIAKRYRIRTRTTIALGTEGPAPPPPVSFQEGWWEQSARIKRTPTVRTRVTIGLGTAGAAPSGVKVSWWAWSLHGEAY